MKRSDLIPQKIFNLADLQRTVAAWRINGHTIAFTNGCFDLLHEGHIWSLSQAAAAADKLIVAVNADASVKRLKGQHRPVNNQHSRALILASLAIVDAVIIFEEDTPLSLITALLPDVLVKGGDYTVDTIVGAKEVMAAGGEVKIVPVLAGFSTTEIIRKMTENR
jgi:D-beta-D-heptose 7-phosphate kinase/D-beta-D-heptose 1-phosphate adenosyltransferase